MIARTTIVPVAERFPVIAVFSWPENVTFSCEDEVGTNRQREFRQAFFQQVNRTPGIDRPDGPGILQPADHLHALCIEHRLAYARNKRPVEIDAEQSNL